jgi:hypothetical protein
LVLLAERLRSTTIISIGHSRGRPKIVAAGAPQNETGGGSF